MIGFSLAGKTIGTKSRAAIRTDTLLGRKNIEIEPRGSDPLQPNGVLPSGQTTTPYQIYDAFADVTNATTRWDVDVIKHSLKVLSETFDQAAPHLSAALDGVARFSDTVGRRDEQLKQLLANAGKVAHVFGDRSEQVNGLLVNASTLLAAFKQRSQALSILLSNVSAASTQVSGLIEDNPDFNHVLGQLGTVSDELVKRKSELAEVLVLISRYTASLSEAVASGPYFKVMVANLVPYWILQPWVDAAFKKRGIDPEEFWRNAGLPAFRFPDPNGARLPNGAPPPAPPVLEGTPEHPGPAVVPGSPCSYAPAAGMFPTRTTRCRARASTKTRDRSARPRTVFRRRSTSRPRCPTPTACRPHPESRSPDGRASRLRTCRARRCRCRRARRRGAHREPGAGRSDSAAVDVRAAVTPGIASTTWPGAAAGGHLCFHSRPAGREAAHVDHL